MKSKTTGVLLAHLNALGFLFNGYRNRDLSKFVEPFQKLILLMPTLTVVKNKVYRARKVDLDKDVDSGKGITMVNGILTGGFDESNSRIAPAEHCNLQRLNRKGEQVFYIAEERDTAINEQKATEKVYLSVAEFDVVSPVRILDFSAYTHEKLNTIITDKMEQDFQEKTDYSARQIYYEFQAFLTILDSNDEYYNISNKICDIIKKDSNIDGIRYWSYYKGHNLGIWRYRPKDYRFVGSNIVPISNFFGKSSE